MGSELFNLLASLGAIDPDFIVEFFPRVRDREDISVLQCTKSGVILLSQSDHMDVQHYAEKKVSPELVSGTRIPSPATLDDDHRRAQQVKHLVRGRRWLDIGTGAAGILDLLSDSTTTCVGVEPNAESREQATSRGHSVYPSVYDVAESGFDLISLFHVFEHLVDPLAVLTRLSDLLTPTGKLWIEVPHARDFLITTLACREFMSFTFWSEHLVLHTRESLSACLQHAGFSNVVTSGYQRYPLSNHLFWISKGKPGGHERWSFLNDDRLSSAYADTLARLDQTDTLISIASHT